MKVDGPKPLKWTVQKVINWTVVKMKVDSPQNMKLDGPQKCVGGQKEMKEHGPRIRWRSIRDESGRSSKVRGRLKE